MHFKIQEMQGTTVRSIFTSGSYEDLVDQVSIEGKSKFQIDALQEEIRVRGAPMNMGSLTKADRCRLESAWMRTN